MHTLILRSVYSLHVDAHAGNSLPKFPAMHKSSGRSSLGPVTPPVPCSKTESLSLHQGVKKKSIPLSTYLRAGKILVYNEIKWS